MNTEELNARIEAATWFVVNMTPEQRKDAMNAGVLDRRLTDEWCDEWRRTHDPALMEMQPKPAPKYEATMPRVNGKPFRCVCGCNVFTNKVGTGEYWCNACDREYLGT